jgi:DNA-binding PadR family transcriptional regulator
MEIETNSPLAAAATATPAQTREEITRISARGYVSLRHVLVQKPKGDVKEGESMGSTVGMAVHERHHRALLLYLLVLTAWPWLAKNRKPLAAAVWLRALDAPGALTWSPSTLSRAWADLATMGLVETERKREGRARRVIPRREDGVGLYDAPGGRRDRHNMYFILPDAFWKEEIFAKLSLPGLAILLIIAKETSGKDEMYLPYSYGPEWYGMSPKSIQNGVKDLERLGLLSVRYESFTAPLSATGRSTRLWYSLTGHFSHDARAAMKLTARGERKSRLDAESRKAAEVAEAVPDPEDKQGGGTDDADEVRL